METCNQKPASSRRIPIICIGHSRPVTEVSFSPLTPDGTFMISGCHDKTPMLRNAETGNWIGTFEGHKGAVLGVALDSKALKAATGSGDYSARIWDSLSGALIAEFPHRHIVKTVKFDCEDRKLATGGSEGIIRVFDVDTAASDTIPLAEIPIPITREGTKVTGTITKVRWGDEPWKIFSGSDDGVVRVWDIRDSSSITSPIMKTTVDGSIMDLEVSEPTGLITVASGTRVTFLNGSNLEVVKSHSIPMSFEKEGGASLNPSGKVFVAGGGDLWARVFDFETGEELECLRGHSGPVRCMRFNPNGKTFASGSEDSIIRIWSL